MKNLKSIVSCLVAVIFMYSCDQGIDEITQVDPGADIAAPTVTINYPKEGTKIKVLESSTEITIDFEVIDDIEINDIKVLLDDVEIESYNTFKDYRKVFIDNLVYSGLNDGSHNLTIIATDLDGKSTSASVNFVKEPAYVKQFDGEIFYMPFDGDYLDLLSLQTASKIGAPTFTENSKVGTNAYAGATDSYITVPTTGLTAPEFSAVMWYKVNDASDRAGILTVGPPNTENAGYPEVQNLRTSGFRLFRENADGLQRIKLNVGNGIADVWVDGAAAADIDPASGEWVHIAFTISETIATVYINGVSVADAETGISWANCDLVSIGSGAPRFTEWGHGADLSSIDELRFFDKALTPEEITAVMNVDSEE